MKRWDVVNVPAGRERTLYGVHAIAGWLLINPSHLRSLHYLPRAGERVSTLIAHATTHGIPTEECSEARLRDMSGSAQHQGVVARTEPFPYVDLENLASNTPRLLVLADQMQDPHNLGALLRTAAAAGAAGVVIPKDGSVPVTATVEAAAAGAGAHVPVCRVTNAARGLQRLRQLGYWAVGLTPRGGRDLYDWRTVEPLVLVVGGERGIRRLVGEQCDDRISIPMAEAVESLNASVAAAIVIYEVSRRWRSS